MIRNGLALLFFLGLLVLAGMPSVQAQELRAAPHGGYGRLVFDYGRPVPFTADVAGGRLVVAFDVPMNADPAPLIGNLSGYLVDSRRETPDGRIWSFGLKGAYGVRSFNQGGAVVVDLLGRAEDAPAPKQATTPTPQPAAMPAPKAAPKPPVQEAKASPPAAAEETEDSPAQGRSVQSPSAPLVPVQTGLDAMVTRLTFQWPQPTAHQVRVQGDSATITFGALGRVNLEALRRNLPSDMQQVSASTDARRLTVTLPVPDGARVHDFRSEATVIIDVMRSDPAPPPPVLPQVVAVFDNDAMRGRRMTEPVAPEQAMASQGGGRRTAADRSRVVSLSFSWSDETGAAVFRRGDYLWVVFDRPRQVDLRTLLAQAGAQGGQILLDAQQVNHSRATVLRMVTQPGFNPSIRREGTLWVLDLMRQPMQPRSSMEVEVQVNTSVGPRLVVPIPQAPDPISIVDPAQGDAFWVVPTRPLGLGMAPHRELTDVYLAVTAQGLMIEERSDRLIVRSTREGVEVSATSGGLRLSRNFEQLLEGGALGTRALSQVFDVAAWERGGEATFTQDSQIMLAAVAGTPDARRDLARLELARFYFANGYAAEALGVLRIIAESAPSMAATPAFRALRGASNVLMERYPEAIDDLSIGALAKNDEARFWRAAAEARMGDPERQLTTLVSTVDVMREYPAHMRYKLAIIATEAALAANDDLQAREFLELAEGGNFTLVQLEALRYYLARTDLLYGNFAAALEGLQRVADGPSRKYRALAAYESIQLRLRNGDISAGQAIDEMERLRYAWRGGDFEFNLLRRLGQLYFEDGRHAEGFRTLQHLLAGFRDHPEAPSVTRLMRETFRNLYMDGGADVLSPVTAIAVFNEFRELTPPGEDGDEMIRKLVDRLVNVDLMPQAARLLEHQVQKRLEGEQKARVGGRLALIYLLDDKPGAALTALDESYMESLPVALEQLRTVLRGRALGESGQTELAVETLEAVGTRNALELAVGYLRRDGQNRRAATMMLRLLPDPDGPEPLSEDEARKILDLATVLTLAEDQQGLAMMRRDYLEAMSRTPFYDGFDMLTSRPGTVATADLQAVQEEVRRAEDFRDFMADYRRRLSGSALSEIN